MAGVHFSFDNLKELIELNIGIADRLDENSAERFTVLYCGFSGLDRKVVDSTLDSVLRMSDAFVNQDDEYYFILPYTDQYGAVTVREMCEEFFDKTVPSCMVSYPASGENVQELLEVLEDEKAKVEINF